MRLWPIGVVTALVLLLALALLPGAFGSGLAIDSCQEVKESVYLTSDLKTNATCLKVTGSNLVIDCAGHTIEGPAATNTGSGRDISIGISGRGVTNVSVQNCWLKDIDYGVFFEDVGAVQVNNTRVDRYFQSGIFIRSGRAVDITESKIGKSAYPGVSGIVLAGTAKAYLEGNNFDTSLATFLSARDSVEVTHFNNTRGLSSVEREDQVTFRMGRRTNGATTDELKQVEPVELAQILENNTPASVENYTGINSSNEVNATALSVPEEQENQTGLSSTELIPTSQNETNQTEQAVVSSSEALELNETKNQSG